MAEYIEKTVDVVSMAHGRPVIKMREKWLTSYHKEIGVFAEDGANLYRKMVIAAKIPYEYCPICGVLLCSRWHNYCGNCGANMEEGE